MKSENIEARACPFCHSVNLRVIQDDAWWVACLGCYAQGPDGKDPWEAIVRWNGDFMEEEAYED